MTMLMYLPFCVEVCMSSVGYILSLAIVLSACQGSKLRDTKGSFAPGTKSADSAESDSKEGATPETSQIVDGLTPVETGDQNVPPDAHIPVAVAGASLVCSLTSGDSELSCSTFRDAAKVDLKPSNFFYDSSPPASKSSAAVWKEISMKPIELGVYSAPAPVDVQSSFVVIMRYNDPKTSTVEHLASRVGVEELNYPNIVKNGDFETEFPFTGDSHDFFAADNASVPWIIGTLPESACAKDAFLRVQTAGASPGLNGARWASLSSSCVPAADSVPSLPSLMQNVPTKPGNFYFVSFQARVDAELAENVKPTLRVQWGTGGEGRALTFAPSKTSWETFSYNSTSNHASVKVYFVGSGGGKNHAVMFDNIKVFDLGVAPPL